VVITRDVKFHENYQPKQGDGQKEPLEAVFDPQTIGKGTREDSPNKEILLKLLPDWLVARGGD